MASMRIGGGGLNPQPLPPLATPLFSPLSSPWSVVFLRPAFKPYVTEELKPIPNSWACKRRGLH